jgi:FkbM family methyltransferase
MFMNLTKAAKASYCRFIFKRVIPLICKIQNDYIFVELSRSFIPICIRKKPIRHLKLEFRNKRYIVCDSISQSKHQILSRARFVRTCLCGGFTGVGEYLAKVYGINLDKKIQTYLEVGPNIGELSSLVLSKNPNLRACLVEGDPVAIESLRYNLRNRLNNSNIELLEVFASDKSGYQEVQLASADASSSLFLDSDHDLNRHLVEVIRLDEVLPKIFEDHVIDLVKVEAEGYEPEVLLGMSNYLIKIRKIVMDCGPERGGEKTIDMCTRILVDAGFTVSATGNYVTAERNEP